MIVVAHPLIEILAVLAGLMDEIQYMNNSWLIQPWPYIVPGTSPVVNSGFRTLRSKITKGGITTPLAQQQQANTVTCDFESPMTALTLLAPVLATTFPPLGLRGILAVKDSGWIIVLLQSVFQQIEIFIDTFAICSHRPGQTKWHGCT